MTDTGRRLCGRLDGCAEGCWRENELGHEACQVVERGKGCGVGSDGHPCSPAYLCPACIALLLDGEVAS